MDYMNSSLVTAGKETTVTEALEMLKNHKIRQLPVVSGEKLVGLVTEKRLLEISPSTMANLGTFETKFFLEQIWVSEVMIKFPLTVTPGTTIEEAALYLREHKVSSVPVVEEDKLVGIITITDIFDALTRFFGYGKPGTRIIIESADGTELLTEVTRIIKEFDFPVKTIIYHVKDDHKVKIRIRIDTVEAGPVVEAMEKNGLKVSMII